MGTVVGVTLRVDEPALARQGFDVAFGAIEAGEAELSAWRPGSATARLAAGAPVALSPEAERLFDFGLRLATRSGGRFDLMWRGGSLGRGADGWSASAEPDLGGVLKGWLNDRAAAALLAAGFSDFLLDAAGDLLAHGDGPSGRGWWVAVNDGTRVSRPVRLRDQALSTSGDSARPGHIHDAAGPVHRRGVAVVVAPSGMVADAVATAVYAGARRDVGAPWGARVLRVPGRRLAAAPVERVRPRASEPAAPR